MEAKGKYVNDKIYGHLGSSICCQENSEHAEKGEEVRMIFFIFIEQFLKKLIPVKRIFQFQG